MGSLPVRGVGCRGSRVSQLSGDLLAQDAGDLPAPPDGWLQAVMHNIHHEIRAGRELPIRHPDRRVSHPIHAHLIACVVSNQRIPDLSTTVRDPVSTAPGQHTELDIAAVGMIIEGPHGHAPPTRSDDHFGYRRRTLHALLRRSVSGAVPRRKKAPSVPARVANTATE